MLQSSSRPLFMGIIPSPIPIPSLPRPIPPWRSCHSRPGSLPPQLNQCNFNQNELPTLGLGTNYIDNVCTLPSIHTYIYFTFLGCWNSHIFETGTNKMNWWWSGRGGSSAQCSHDPVCGLPWQGDPGRIQTRVGQSAGLFCEIVKEE